MAIKFSKHAKERLKERNIPAKVVREVIKNPDSSEKSFKNRILLRKVSGDKILEAATVKDGEDTVVVTAYYLEE